MSLKWIAARLQMGTWTYVSNYGLGQLLATTGRSLLRTRMSARRWLCRDAPRGEGGRTRVSLRKLAPTGPSLLEKRA
jgi:hypothetical protein